MAAESSQMAMFFIKNCISIVLVLQAPIYTYKGSHSLVVISSYIFRRKWTTMIGVIWLWKTHRACQRLEKVICGKRNKVKELKGKTILFSALENNLYYCFLKSHSKTMDCECVMWLWDRGQVSIFYCFVDAYW
jgi:hypothetical protein